MMKISANCTRSACLVNVVNRCHSVTARGCWLRPRTEKVANPWEDQGVSYTHIRTDGSLKNTRRRRED